MKKTLLGAAIALLSSSVVFAQDYQFEIGAQYDNGDNGSTDFDGYGFDAKLHLKKVDTSKGPLNEAAFLDKSSFATLSWVTSKADFSGAKSEDEIAIGGRFVTGSNIIIEADYTDYSGYGDDTGYSVGVGSYIGAGMDVVASYDAFDKSKKSTFAVDLHGLSPLKGETAVAFDAGLSYIDVSVDDGYGITAGADYYINNAVSIGAGFGYASIGDFDSSSFDVRADYFVTPIARLGLGYTTEGQDAEGDAIQLNGSVRF